MESACPEESGLGIKLKNWQRKSVPHATDVLMVVGWGNTLVPPCHRVGTTKGCWAAGGNQSRVTVSSAPFPLPTPCLLGQPYRRTKLWRSHRSSAKNESRLSKRVTNSGPFQAFGGLEGRLSVETWNPVGITSAGISLNPWFREGIIWAGPNCPAILAVEGPWLLW